MTWCDLCSSRLPPLLGAGGAGPPGAAAGAALSSLSAAISSFKSSRPAKHQPVNFIADGAPPASDKAKPMEKE